METQIEIITTQEELATAFGVNVAIVQEWHTQGLPFIQYQKESGGAFYPCYFVPAVAHWLRSNGDCRAKLPDDAALAAYVIPDPIEEPAAE